MDEAAVMDAGSVVHERILSMLEEAKMWRSNGDEFRAEILENMARKKLREFIRYLKE